MSFPSPFSFISQALKEFRNQPWRLMKMGLWLILPMALLGLALGFGVSILFSTFLVSPILAPSHSPVWIIALFITIILIALLPLWTIIRLQRGALFISAGHPIPANDGPEAFHLIPRYVWAKVLQALSSVALLLIVLLAFSIGNFVIAQLAVVGYTHGVASDVATFSLIFRVFNIVCGILGIIGLVMTVLLYPRIQFAAYAVLDKGLTGWQGLKESWNITRGRWFTVAWCDLVISVIFILIGISVSFIFVTLGKTLHVEGILSFINSAFEVVILTPILILVMAYFYHAMQRSRV